MSASSGIYSYSNFRESSKLHAAGPSNAVLPFQIVHQYAASKGACQQLIAFSTFLCSWPSMRVLDRSNLGRSGNSACSALSLRYQLPPPAPRFGYSIHESGPHQVIEPGLGSGGWQHTLRFAGDRR